jgi:predicted ATP-binding protein involved in virulence
MRIDKLEINNFRCFKHLEMELHPRLNVLVGVNGSGKTALLEAVRAALGAFFTGFENEDVEQFYLNENDVRLEYHGVTKTEHRPVKIKCVGEVGAKKGVIWVREFNKKTSSNTAHIGDIRNVAKQMSLNVRDQVPVELPILFYFSTQRLWAERKDFGLKANGNRFGGYFNSLNAKSASFFFADWFARQEQHEYQNAQMGLGKDFSQLELVRQIAVKCMPECKRLYFNALEGKMFIQFNDHDTPVSLLSDGQKTILLLCTGIAMQCVLLNPHLGLKANEAPGIVLIDEADLHLHPAWQRKILPDLMEAFPNLQFIATTHSPQVIGRISKESVFLLKNFKIESGKIFTEGRDSNSILQDVFGISKRPLSEQQLLNSFYLYLENKNQKDALSLLEKLETLWGEQDAEIVRANLYYQDLLNEVHP